MENPVIPNESDLITFLLKARKQIIKDKGDNHREEYQINDFDLCVFLGKADLVNISLWQRTNCGDDSYRAFIRKGKLHVVGHIFNDGSCVDATPEIVLAKLEAAVEKIFPGYKKLKLTAKDRAVLTAEITYSNEDAEQRDLN